MITNFTNTPNLILRNKDCAFKGTRTLNRLLKREQCSSSCAMKATFICGAEGNRNPTYAVQAHRANRYHYNPIIALQLFYSGQTGLLYSSFNGRFKSLSRKLILSAPTSNFPGLKQLSQEQKGSNPQRWFWRPECYHYTIFLICGSYGIRTRLCFRRDRAAATLAAPRTKVRATKGNRTLISSVASWCTSHYAIVA